MRFLPPPLHLTSLATAIIGLAISPFAVADTVVYVSESKENRIAIFSLDEETGDLARIGQVDLEGAPGCLAIRPDQRHLYASVRSAKQFATLAIDPTTGLLESEGTAPAAGSASYLFPDRTGRWLLAAYYGDGAVSVSRIKADGRIDREPILTHLVGEKAHWIQTDPSNRFAFCPHTGLINKIDCFRFDPETGHLDFNTPPMVGAKEGQGPRHLQFHPGNPWVYAVNEQEKSVTRYEFDSGTGGLTARETITTIPSDWDPSQGSCADIEISSDGRFLYASNRGHDSIAMFSIDADSGKLASLGQIATAKTPRSFNLMPQREDFLIAAGQGDGQLIVYRRDREAGSLTRVKSYSCGEGPAWVLGVKLR